MSLRTVAEEAETSVGSISYRIGDRAALIAAVLDREIALMSAARREWHERVNRLEALRSEILPDLICEWLEQGAQIRRISAIVTCELALMASREPAALPAINLLFDEAEGLWRDLLPMTPAGKDLAHLVSCYCMDEQVFSILLADETDYRLLRHSTIRGLLREAPSAGAVAATAAWSLWHMALVERLAIPAGPAHEDDAGPPQGVKAELADQIANLIVSDGVGAPSHRAVAQIAGVATSNIQHHFPTQRDILFAGVEALYRRMRSDIRSSKAVGPSRIDIVRLTHECALTALRVPAFRPFAIDMRRRRAENVHVQVAEWMGLEPNSDRAKVQAFVVAAVGQGLRTAAMGRTAETHPQVIANLTAWYSRID